MAQQTAAPAPQVAQLQLQLPAKPSSASQEPDRAGSPPTPTGMALPPALEKQLSGMLSSGVFEDELDFLAELEEAHGSPDSPQNSGPTPTPQS